jgi:hypothetical protein
MEKEKPIVWETSKKILILNYFVNKEKGMLVYKSLG